MPPKAVNALEGIDVTRISHQLVLAQKAAQAALLAEKVPEKKGPETRSATVFRRVGGVKKSWKETTMSLESSSLGICTFADGGEICVRQAVVDVPWVFEERVGQKFYFSITDTGKSKSQEMLLVPNPSELEKWLVALETHAAIIHNFLRVGSMSFFFMNNNKKKEEAWFVLYPDGLHIYKQKFDQKPFKVIAIGEANEFERLPEGFVLAESGDELANSITCTCVNNDVGLWGDEVEKAVIAKRQKKCFDSIKEGYLSKCNADMKFWKRRFCVLMPDHIKYFKKRFDDHPAGTIGLPSGAEAEDVDDSIDSAHPNMFWVAENGDETGTRRYCMTASSLLEKEQWLHALHTLFSHHNYRQHPFSLKEGYLYHLSPGTSNIKTGKWSKQFIVLMKGCLLYFKKRTDSQALGTIDLTQGAEFSAPFIGSDLPSETFIMTLSENGDEQGTPTHFFRANDEVSRNGWIDTVTEVLKDNEIKVQTGSMKEGYMYKQNTQQKWNKRYFILLGDKLLYYKKRQDKSEAGEIPLPGSAEITCLTGDDPNYKWMFTIAESGDESGVRTYYVACSTESLRTQWVNVLTKIIKAKDSRILMGSFLEGYLWKCPEGGGVWRKRYFVLKQNQLLYFRKRADPSSAGCIEIKGEAQIMMIDDDIEHPYSFSVAKNGDEGVREVKIYAPDAPTRDEWVRCLRQQVAMLAVKTKADSLREGYVNLWTALGWRRKFFVLDRDSLKLYSKRSDQNFSSVFVLDEKTVVFLQDSARSQPQSASSSSASSNVSGSWNIPASEQKPDEQQQQQQQQQQELTVSSPEGEKKLPTSPSFEGKEGLMKEAATATAAVAVTTPAATPTAVKEGEGGEEDIVGNSDDHKSTGASILLCKNGDQNARRFRLKMIYDAEASFVCDAMQVCISKEFSSLVNKKENSNESFAIFKSGYVSVRFKASGGLNSKDRWALSWVTLTSDDFFVYKSRDDEFPVLSVCVDVAAVIYAGLIPGTSTWNPLCITLRDSTEREISFITQTAEEKNSWMLAIQRSIDLFKEKKRPHKAELFGGELKQSFAKSNYYNLPFVLAGCIDFLQKQPLSYCLLRMPGSHPLVRSFIQDFEYCENVVLSDPESVASCLRLYLLMLKKPVLSEALTQNLFAVLTKCKNVASAVTDKDVIAQFQQQLFASSLSSASFSASASFSSNSSPSSSSPSLLDNESSLALGLILRFLAHEIKRPEEVHLTAERVAPIWAPLLMRYKTEESSSSSGSNNNLGSITAITEQQKMSEADLSQQVLLVLLKNMSLFFPGELVLVHKLPRKQLQKIKTENASSLNYELLRGCNYGKELFGRFVKENHIEEDVLFLSAVQRYKDLCENCDSTHTQRLARGLQIYSEFVRQGAETQVNVSDSVSKMILERLDGKNALKALTGNEFFEAEGQAVLLINTNSWPRFKQSEAYDHWVTYREQLKQRPAGTEEPDVPGTPTAGGGHYSDFRDHTPSVTPRGSPRPSNAEPPPPPPPEVESAPSTTPHLQKTCSASSFSSSLRDVSPHSPPEKSAPRRQAPVGRAPARPFLQSANSLSNLGISDMDSPPSVSKEALARAQSADLPNTSVFDDLPPPPPEVADEVWFVRKTTKGVPYYINTVNKVTTYKAPEEALIYSCSFDAEGRQCFTNNKDSSELFEVPECLRDFAKTYKLY